MEAKTAIQTFGDVIAVEHSIGESVVRHVINMQAKLEEEAVIRWLINKGWTPPKEVTEKLCKG